MFRYTPPFALIAIVGVSILLLMPASAWGQYGFASPTARAKAQELTDRLLQEPAEATIARLDALASDTAIDPVERDAIAFEIVRGLRKLEPGRIDPRVLERLQNWEPLSWRQHEESSNWFEPRFNVAAAARGLENQWAFAEGLADGIGSGSRTLDEALVRFGDDPRSPYARGLRASVNDTAADRRGRLIELCQADPLLVEQLLPEAWLANDDLVALSDWLSAAPGARVTAVLARAREQLPARRFLPLAAAAQRHADPSIRSLALARQTDAWVEIQSWPEPWAAELWQLLDDDEMAATAAVQLARLDAARRWRSSPERAPRGALESKELKRIERLAATLPNEGFDR